MRLDAAVWFVLVASVLAATLPFLTDRVLLIGPKPTPKGWGWRLVELLLVAGLAAALGMAREARLGQIQQQSWEFYVAFACLFLTFAFPGFVWRYLRRGTA